MQYGNYKTVVWTDADAKSLLHVEDGDQDKQHSAVLHCWRSSTHRRTTCGSLQFTRVAPMPARRLRGNKRCYVHGQMKHSNNATVSLKNVIV